MDDHVDMTWISRDSGIPLSTVYYLNKKGLGPPSQRLGRKFLVKRTDYEDWKERLA